MFRICKHCLQLHHCPICERDFTSLCSLRTHFRMNPDTTHQVLVVCLWRASFGGKQPPVMEYNYDENDVQWLLHVLHAGIDTDPFND